MNDEPVVPVAENDPSYVALASGDVPIPPAPPETIDNPDAAMKVSSAPGMGFIPVEASAVTTFDPVQPSVVPGPPVGELGSDFGALSSDAVSAGEKLGLDLMAIERDLNNAGLSIVDVLKHTAKAAFGIDL